MSKLTVDEAERLFDLIRNSDCIWTNHLIYYDGIEPVVFNPSSVSSTDRFIERLVETGEIIKES